VRFFKVSLIIILVISICGCGWWKSLWIGPEPKNPTAENLYQRGHALYQYGRYDKALEVFQRVKDEFPLSEYALMADLGIADSHFVEENYIEAEATYNGFIELHPTNPNVPYVMYQLGMCHFEQLMDLDRDQTETQKARQEFERLMVRFPNSKFAFMAEKKLKECKQRQAEHEFYIGEFYYNQKKYKAALKRFEYVAKEYANLGVDYKVNYYLAETKKRIQEDETRTRLEAEKAKK
jgi:outer membrane protein assembly factor BamD